MTDSDSNTALPAILTEQIRELCRLGYSAYDAGDFKLAIRRFFEAWTRLPKPQTQWVESGWVLTALGDAYFAKGNYDNGREALQSAVHCPQTGNNPFVHLRLGQCLFETGDVEGARRAFQEVLHHGGGALLEAEHAKYRGCLND